MLASSMNSKLLNERVEHSLRIDDPESIRGPVQLIPAIFPSLVITTNMDNLLEEHYSRCGTPFQHSLAGKELARYRDLKTPKECFLLKLHGDIRWFETEYS